VVKTALNAIFTGALEQVSRDRVSKDGVFHEQVTHE